MSAPAKPPAKLKTTVDVSEYVDITVDISEFSDEVILQAAREICAKKGIADFVEAADKYDPQALAHDAYLAFIERNEPRERQAARELVGAIVGRIL